MNKPLILRIALPTPLRRLFDYLPPEDYESMRLIPGSRVKVPFQTRTLVGILIEVTEQSEISLDKLKKALEIIDIEPIYTEEMFKLCQWAAEYYHYALGEVLNIAMPVYLRKGKSIPVSHVSPKIQLKKYQDTRPILNETQDRAVQAISSKLNQFKTFLLDGITGSGKTEVYLRVIDQVLALEKQILVLVPEISLTPQTIERFEIRFQVCIAVLHSNLSTKVRLQNWLAAKNGTAKIVIGTRSAIFTPFSNLGLIIIDEEHDQSFKQQDRFRYHARDLAIMRASLLSIPIILGSATPSLESLLNVKKNRFEHLSLPTRAGNAVLPTYEMIDIRHESLDEGLSNALLISIENELIANNQVMLFLNRRGFAPVLYCTECAWIMCCKRCDTKMIYHQKPECLRCHHCDSKRSITKMCEQCHQESLLPVGIGTQRLEERLKSHFPGVPIIRLDRDTTKKKDAMHHLLEQIQILPKAILIGTQMIAKGHHFPNVTLVGIVDADAGLFSADFRAVEQMGQLILQVAGRAGRENKLGKVLLQTRQPNHPLLTILLQDSYASFAAEILKERQQAFLPPYAYCAVIRAESYTEKFANDFLTSIKKLLPNQSEAFNLFGPMPALISKKKGLYCHHLMLTTQKRSLLQTMLKQLITQIEKISNVSSVKWILDVDPIEVI